MATDQHVWLKILQHCRLIRHTRDMSMPFRAKTLLPGSFTARRLLGSLSGAAAAAGAAAACTRCWHADWLRGGACRRRLHQAGG